MSTVFPGVSRKTNEMVVTYLAFNNGATVEQIVAATGISRAQVHLVIRSNELIKHVGNKGRAHCYSVDTEKLASLTVLPTLVADVERHNSDMVRVKENLEVSNGLTVTEQIAFLRGTLAKANGWLDKLAAAEHLAIGIQNGNVSDTEAAMLVWAQALSKLEALKRFGLFLDAYSAKYVDDPIARSPEWWTLFPKETDNGSREQG